ncbi:MAG: hypothetical protein ACLT3W_05915 [Bifidobacterium pseudocatenulatum]
MTQAASDTCTLERVAALATHQQNFEEAQKEAEDAAKLTVDDVADGTTLETLKDAITLAEAVENAPTCPANGNASDFTKATDDIRTYADNLRNITNEPDRGRRACVILPARTANSRVRQVESRQPSHRRADKGAAPSSSAAPAAQRGQVAFSKQSFGLVKDDGLTTSSQPEHQAHTANRLPLFRRKNLERAD